MTAEEASQALIFTAATCHGKIGPGGYAALLMCDGQKVLKRGRWWPTTENRMQLSAAIAAFQALPAGIGARVRSDSVYLIRGITEWLLLWKGRDWITSAGTRVKHRDLWEMLEACSADRLVVWELVESQEGCSEGDEVADIADEEARLSYRALHASNHQCEVTCRRTTDISAASCAEFHCDLQLEPISNWKMGRRTRR